MPILPGFVSRCPELLFQTAFPLQGLRAQTFVAIRQLLQAISFYASVNYASAKTRKNWL
jgi:hypothetical protein